MYQWGLSILYLVVLHKLTSSESLCSLMRNKIFCVCALRTTLICGYVECTHKPHWFARRVKRGHSGSEKAVFEQILEAHKCYEGKKAEGLLIGEKSKAIQR